MVSQEVPLLDIKLNKVLQQIENEEFYHNPFLPKPKGFILLKKPKENETK